jgi:hypothetical protein
MVIAILIIQTYLIIGGLFALKTFNNNSVGCEILFILTILLWPFVWLWKLFDYFEDKVNS